MTRLRSPIDAVGCPEAYALAVSGVGDSELAQRVRSAVATIAAARANDFAADFKRTLAARRQGGWLHRHPPTSLPGVAHSERQRDVYHTAILLVTYCVLSVWQHAYHDSLGTVWEPCLGCSAPSAIKIVKRCGCCTSRDECRCSPQWCEECLLKWWLSSNQKRVERSTPAPGVGMVAMGIDPRWTARCPTCRASFCLNDVVPVEVRARTAWR